MERGIGERGQERRVRGEDVGEGVQCGRLQRCVAFAEAVDEEGQILERQRLEWKRQSA